MAIDPRFCPDEEPWREAIEGPWLSSTHDSKGNAPIHRPRKLICTTESSVAFKLCQQAISNCQELYFLEDTATPILQTDASDYGIAELN